jgi:hypothetical protein
MILKLFIVVFSFYLLAIEETDKELEDLYAQLFLLLFLVVNILEGLLKDVQLGF